MWKWKDFGRTREEYETLVFLEPMQEEANNKSKKVLIHAIGWPLFLVSIYLCTVKGGTIAWEGVHIVAYMAKIDQSQPIHTILVIVSHATTRFVLSFFIAYLFSVFIFRQKRNRMVFSLAVSFFCALLILWFGISVAMNT